MVINCIYKKFKGEFGKSGYNNFIKPDIYEEIVSDTPFYNVESLDESSYKFLNMKNYTPCITFNVYNSNNQCSLFQKNFIKNIIQFIVYISLLNVYLGN